MYRAKKSRWERTRRSNYGGKVKRKKRLSLKRKKETFK